MKIVYIIGVFFMLSTVCFADILIVAHPSVSETALSKKEVNDIFLGKKRYWNDNSSIRLACMVDGKVSEVFLEQYLNKTPCQYRTFVQKKMFTGPAESRKQFQSAGKMIDYVAATPGAIGYVDSQSKPDRVAVMAVED